MNSETKKTLKTTSEIIALTQSYEDCCKLRGEDPTEALPYKNPTTKRQYAANDNMRLEIIADAIRQGVDPNLTDGSRKWFPYFTYQYPGFCFSDSDYGHWIAGAFCGSRLSFSDEALSDHFGSHPEFLKIHNRLLINKY